MVTRWVVDVDGLGGFAVAQAGERCEIVSRVMPLERCERELVRMRERDISRETERKREHGRKLAASRWADH